VSPSVWWWYSWWCLLDVEVGEWEGVGRGPRSGGWGKERVYFAPVSLSSCMASLWIFLLLHAVVVNEPMYELYQGKCARGPHTVCISILVQHV
jgi:hypothetical protein